MTLIRHPFALTSIMALSSLNLLRADPRTSDWSFKTEGPSWQLKLEHRVIPQLARAEEAVVIGYPWNSPSQPGQFARASREVSVVAGKRYRLTFFVSDSFTGLTAGYHFLQILVDGAVVWESDVAGGDLTPQSVCADITNQVQGKEAVTVAFRVFDKKAVANFAVEAWWGGVKLSVDQGTSIEVTRPAKLTVYRPYPPDPPIPSLPLAGSDWTRCASLLQPWGATQWVAVAQRQQWLPRWREEFGFNAIAVLPPDSHNSITEVFHDKSGRTYISEDAFQAALKDYRKHGLRVILYSGVMHCGHAPVWQFGQLSKEHPDWSQRDKDGNPVMDYGAEWLCPSSPALDYTINYTIDLIRRYDPDAIMLDNNQFFTTGKGPTCYCVHCQRKFREYMVRRFTQAQLLEFFNLSPGQLTIPTDPGPLFNLWIHWRNRVWAEATEEFRRRLRAIKSDLVLLANTAYDYPGWLLAGDLQYAHEDAVLSESRGLSSWGMAEKMVVGRALAKNRPLWNYIGTFDDNDFRLLRDPNTIRLIVSASLTHCANPWIVFYGFDEMQSQNAPSLAELGRCLRWYRKHEQYFVNVVPYTPVASIISVRSRSYLNQPLLPSHVGSLLRRHLTPVGLADQYLFESDLTQFRVIVAEGVACLSDLAAEKLVRWIRSGGTLVATPDAGWQDEYGRLRSLSVLLSKTVGRRALTTSFSVGKGKLRFVGSAAELPETVASSVGQPLVRLQPDLHDMEVTGYLQLDEAGRIKSLIIHLLNHANERDFTGKTVLSVQLPEDFKPKRVLQLSPEGKGEQSLDFKEQPSRAISVRLPQLPSYCVLVISNSLGATR